MNKKILNLISMLILSSNFVSNAKEVENIKALDNVPGDNVSTSKQNTNFNTKGECKFEIQWVNAVYEIIKYSNEESKRNVNDLKKNTYSSTPSYVYSFSSSSLPSTSVGGAIYCDGYLNFDDFKKEVFRSILRHFLSNRARYLCSEILKKQQSSNDLSSECEELKEIVEVISENGFELIVEHADLNNLELTLV